MAALSARREAFLLHRRDRSLLPSGEAGHDQDWLARSGRVGRDAASGRFIGDLRLRPGVVRARPDVDGYRRSIPIASTDRRCRSRDRTCQHGGQSLCQRVRLGEWDARVRVRRLTESTAIDVVRSSGQAPRHAGRGAGWTSIFHSRQTNARSQSRCAARVRRISISGQSTSPATSERPEPRDDRSAT